MDWDQTNPTCIWDAISKIELQDNNNNYHQHFGAFASSSHHQSSTVLNHNMFSVDLKLGRLEDMPDLSVDTVKNSEDLSMTMASLQQTSGSSRTRGRARSAGAQATVYCSVDGCTSDLSQCREYHRRHRVCERHSKTPVVLIAGKEQRFCQQCSRFHSLGEFDEVKRSCRKRLAGHNLRRRKTQPENFYINSGSLHSSNTGNGLMQFRNLQGHTSPWSVLPQPQPDQKASTIYNHYDPLTSLSDNLSWSTICTRSNSPPLLTDCTSLTATTSSSNTKDVLKFSQPDSSLTQSSHSECALSLLSHHPARSSGGLYNPTHTTQPLPARSSPHGFGSALHLNDGFAHFSGTQAMEDESSASLSSTSNDNSGHNFGGFLTGQDGFCANTSSRVFPFIWG